MANRKLFAAMLAIVLALGMTAAGCSKSLKSGGNATEGEAANSKTDSVAAAKSGGGTTSGGTTWTAAKESPFGKDGAITAIAWGKDKFVAGSASGEIAYLPN